MSWNWIGLALAQGPSQAGVGGVGATGVVPLNEQIATIFNFAFLAGGILAFGVIVWAGIRYTLSAGNPSAQSDSRDQIGQAFLGLLLLFGSGLVLNTINPDLISVSLPDMEKLPPLVQVFPSGNCKPLSAGPASVEALAQTCFGSNAEKASAIANAESGGNAFSESGVDKCTSSGAPVSFGLFQINISANVLDTPSGQVDCRKAFDKPYTGSNKDCKIIDVNLYNQCRKLAFDTGVNIKTACRLSNNGANWGLWGANSKCGF